MQGCYFPLFINAGNLLSGVANTLTKHLKILIGKEQACLRPGFSSTDHINILRIIPEGCVALKSPFQLLSTDFEKTLVRGFVCVI